MLRYLYTQKEGFTTADALSHSQHFEKLGA